MPSQLEPRRTVFQVPRVALEKQVSPGAQTESPAFLANMPLRDKNKIYKHRASNGVKSFLVEKNMAQANSWYSNGTPPPRVPML